MSPKEQQSPQRSGSTQDQTSRDQSGRFRLQQPCGWVVIYWAKEERAGYDSWNASRNLVTLADCTLSGLEGRKVMLAWQDCCGIGDNLGEVAKEVR